MNPLVQRAADESRAADSKVDQFFERVEQVLGFVPEPLRHLIEAIRLGLVALEEKIRDFQERIAGLWEQRGDADRLRQVGERWVAEVGDVLGDIAAGIAPDKLRTAVEWEGRAARAYQLAVPPQAAGLNAVKDIANQLRASLNSLANSLDVFWLSISFALAGFVVGAVVAIAAACTVVGIPAAIAALATAVATSLAVVGATVLALESHFNTIETEQAAIRQKVHDLGSTWSAPNTADMADASVTDGDGSDWRPGS
ncbi:hypothetical protein [Saccharothrix sp.]|uniref:hypothetical protein n=1 Tax=Saccharothrix sp. TaxID=1873460 RepID=UPI002811F560|nr:hypothetical protein [Saccharothrix sp.]